MKFIRPRRLPRLFALALVCVATLFAYSSVSAQTATALPAGAGVVNLTNGAGVVTAVRTVREFSIVQGTTVLTPYAEVDFKTSRGSDSYNALQTQLSRRFGTGLTMNAQYTLAKSTGTTAGSNEARTVGLGTNRQIQFALRLNF